MCNQRHAEAKNTTADQETHKVPYFVRQKKVSDKSRNKQLTQRLSKKGQEPDYVKIGCEPFQYVYFYVRQSHFVVGYKRKKIDEGFHGKT